MRLRCLSLLLLSSAGGLAQVQKLGVYDYMTEESSPLIFNGLLVMLESIPRSYAGFDTTGFANCSAYMRVRDMKTLRVIVNISATCGMAFGAATVLPGGAAGASDTLVVSATQWDRTHVSPVLRESGSQGWTGPCDGASPTNCTVNLFFSSSPTLEDASWSSRSPGIPVPFGVYNTDIMAVPAAAHLPWKFVMALETTRERARFLVSESADPTDVAAWAVLNESYTVPALPDTGSCPSLRHDGSWFYYLTGGRDIHILRSQDLLSSSWTESSGVVLSHSTPGDCVVAPAFFGPYIPTGVALQRLEACGPAGTFGDDSDVDLTQWDAPGDSALGPGPVVLLEYGAGDQRTFGFSNLAVFNGTMTAFLQSFF